MSASVESGWRAEPGTEVYEEVRARVIDAAERHVAENGLGRVRIEEIAAEADCSRATIYRYFEDKDELIRAVLIRRARLINERLAVELADVADPADLLVSGVLRGVEELRADDYFETFYGPAAAGTTVRLTGGTTALREVVSEMMEPLFELAESTGRLRPELSRDEATEWTMMITLALLTMPTPEQRTASEQADFLRKLLVPSLLI